MDWKDSSKSAPELQFYWNIRDEGRIKCEKKYQDGNLKGYERIQTY